MLPGSKLLPGSSSMTPPQEVLVSERFKAAAAVAGQVSGSSGGHVFPVRASVPVNMAVVPLAVNTRGFALSGVPDFQGSRFSRDPRSSRGPGISRLPGFSGAPGFSEVVGFPGVLGFPGFLPFSVVPGCPGGHPSGEQKRSVGR